jgi:hypothetical protein
MTADAIVDALEWKTRARNAEYACREAYRLLVDQDTAMRMRDLEAMLYVVLKKAGMT